MRYSVCNRYASNLVLKGRFHLANWAGRQRHLRLFVFEPNNIYDHVTFCESSFRKFFGNHIQSNQIKPALCWVGEVRNSCHIGHIPSRHMTPFVEIVENQMTISANVRLRTTRNHWNVGCNWQHQSISRKEWWLSRKWVKWIRKSSFQGRVIAVHVWARLAVHYGGPGNGVVVILEWKKVGIVRTVLSTRNAQRVFVSRGKWRNVGRNQK